LPADDSWHAEGGVSQGAEVALLEGLGLTVALAGRSVLHRVEVRLRRGEMVGLIGPNGAGKTTLLRTLAHLLPPEAGGVLLGGVPLTEMAPRERARRLGYLAQGAPVHWP